MNLQLPAFSFYQLFCLNRHSLACGHPKLTKKFSPTACSVWSHWTHAAIHPGCAE